MIEVFRTNVKNQRDANKILCLIHMLFTEYQANFDLNDCDRILRIKSKTETLDNVSIINLLRTLGYSIEILPDEIKEAEQISTKFLTITSTDLK
jgi:ABC-type bacteriocin/lantibiotic exporter with double-glycine peptidase domain